MIATDTFLDKVARRSEGICTYGIVPPKLTTPDHEVAVIAQRHLARFERLRPDGVVVYDLQDESERIDTPRPFPYLPTIDSEAYAAGPLGMIAA